MDLKTLLQTCFTKQEALNKLGKMREEMEKKIYTVTGVGNEHPAPNNELDEMHQLESELKKTEALVIFTAIPLPQEQIPILGYLVRKTFPQVQFIDLKVDPTLVGGASLGWKGEYKDYSLRNKIVWK